MSPFPASAHSEGARSCAGAEGRVWKRTDVCADARRSDARHLRRIRHTDAARAARHAEQRRRGCALSAKLGGLAGQAVGVGFQVGIGVRLHAELGDEQRQRQQVNDQAATTTSEQGPGLRGGSIRRPQVRDNGISKPLNRYCRRLMSGRSIGISLRSPRFASNRHDSAM